MNSFIGIFSFTLISHMFVCTHEILDSPPQASRYLYFEFTTFKFITHLHHKFFTLLLNLFSKLFEFVGKIPHSELYLVILVS
jgi:hypothetical protein